MTTRGHFICITGARKPYGVGEVICRTIRRELSIRKIKYTYEDNATMVSSNQYSNFAKNNLQIEADAIKLIALQRKRVRVPDNAKMSKEDSRIEEVANVDLLILPADRHFDKKKYQGKLIVEKKKNALFGEGPISPLVVLQDVKDVLGGNIKIETKVFSAGLDTLKKDNVIFSAGDNKHAIVMDKDNFIKLLKQLNVKEKPDVLKDEL